MTQLHRHENWYKSWKELLSDIEENIVMMELLSEHKDDSTAHAEELQQVEEQYGILSDKFQSMKIKALLSGKFDANGAYLNIHTGAGGMESCDWVKMLLRMYSRWCEVQGYDTIILDMQETEGGIKSVLLEVKGEFAYGYLSAEVGIHRLVRLSPFDSNKRRHTTFASVYVTPIIDNEVEIDIKPDDIRIDTFRASGAGGQHVNTTDSAVRITHLETGVMVQCQNERSQIKNKQIAMKILKSRLYTYYEAEQKKEQEKHAMEKTGVSWGNQIRSYVFHPYNMVKDHRTNKETGNIQAVMNGEINMFIEAFLQEKALD